MQASSQQTGSNCAISKSYELSMTVPTVSSLAAEVNRRAFEHVCVCVLEISFKSFHLYFLSWNWTSILMFLSSCVFLPQHSQTPTHILSNTHITTTGPLHSYCLCCSCYGNTCISGNPMNRMQWAGLQGRNSLTWWQVETAKWCMSLQRALDSDSVIFKTPGLGGTLCTIWVENRISEVCCFHKYGCMGVSFWISQWWKNYLIICLCAAVFWSLSKCWGLKLGS